MDKIILIAHSQGGLYAQQFCRLYPEIVRGIILLDPLSAGDLEFKKKLSQKEYRKAGIDKSGNFKIMRKLAQLKLGFLTKMMLKNAPPFYYYHSFEERDKNEILNSAFNPVHALTALEEYTKAHEISCIQTLSNKEGFPDIPLILITHSSALGMEENIKFGHNTREFAAKIEELWQNIMKEYLSYSEKSIWIEAQRSTHYIHLTEPELIGDAVIRVMQYDK